jgi:FkbM family methyltransferase
MKIIRRLVELLSRGLILKRCISVNNRLIPLYITPDAQLKYLKLGKNAFDSDLIKIAEKFLQKESNVWDIGGNVGIFTFAASEIACNGKILCVEADIWLASIIIRSKRLKHHRAKNISIIPGAISDKNSISKFLIAERGRASNSLAISKGRSQMGGIRDVLYVPTITLDCLFEKFGKPDFIKIDIEGAELMALSGASNILINARPIFYIEVGEEVSKEVFDIFNKNKYRAYDFDGHYVKSSLFANLFFIPEEKGFVFS